jgi:DNA-binding CsgD family transcriptional regulator
MSVGQAQPGMLERRPPLPPGGLGELVRELRSVFGDLIRLHAQAAGIRAEARDQVPDDLDERLAGLTESLGRTAGRLSSLGTPPPAAGAGGQASAGQERSRRVAAGPGQGWAALTPAELEVIRVVISGRTNRQAAAQLFLSPHTISSHLRHAYVKLGINSRVDLVRMALGPDAAPTLHLVATSAD